MITADAVLHCLRDADLQRPALRPVVEHASSVVPEKATPQHPPFWK
jgi:hypothetical protein